MSMQYRHFGLALLASSLFACAAPDDSVVIEHDTLYLADSASPVSRPAPDASRPVSARAIGGTAAAPITYEGTIAADGTITFPGVASLPVYVFLTYAPAPNVVDAPGIVSGFPISSRHARLGDAHVGRPDVPATTMDTTRVALHVTGLAPWSDELSTLGLFSRRADVWAYAYAGNDPTEVSPPMAGATSLDGWSIAVSALNLPYGGALPRFDTTMGDDVVVYGFDSSPLVGVGEPWVETYVTRVTGFGAVADATLADGATTSLTTALSAPNPSPFALDFRGSELLALRSALGVPAGVGTNVYIALVRESGDGPDYFNAVTPSIFEISAGTQPVPDDPTCFPDDMGTCDPVACASGCNTATHDVDPGDLTTSIDTIEPFGAGRDVLTYDVSWTQSWQDSGGVNHPIDQHVIYYRPAASGQAVGVVLSPPLHIRVDGTELPIAPGSASIASATPTITWDPPAQGTAHSYRLDVVAQRTFMLTGGGTTRRRTAASFFTFDPTFTLPPGILIAGADYFVRVTASEATWRDDSLGQPGGSNASIAYNASGVFHF